jgi:hypothetical protein
MEGGGSGVRDQGGCLSVLTGIAGVIGIVLLSFLIGHYGYVVFILIAWLLVASSAAYTLAAGAEFCEQHPAFVFVVALGSGLFGLALLPLAAIVGGMAPKDMPELAPGLWAVAFGMGVSGLLLMLDAIALFSRLWEARESSKLRPTKVCSACGSKNPAWRMYCDICGRPLG